MKTIYNEILQYCRRHTWLVLVYALTNALIGYVEAELNIAIDGTALSSTVLLFIVSEAFVQPIYDHYMGFWLGRSTTLYCDRWTEQQYRSYAGKTLTSRTLNPVSEVEPKLDRAGGAMSQALSMEIMNVMDMFSQMVFVARMLSEIPGITALAVLVIGLCFTYIQKQSVVSRKKRDEHHKKADYSNTMLRLVLRQVQSGDITVDNCIHYLKDASAEYMNANLSVSKHNMMRNVLVKQVYWILMYSATIRSMRALLSMHYLSSSLTGISTRMQLHEDDYSAWQTIITGMQDSSFTTTIQSEMPSVIRVVDSVSPVPQTLEIASGSRILVTGSSGSGKTRLVQRMCGVLEGAELVPKVYNIFGTLYQNAKETMDTNQLSLADLTGSETYSVYWSMLFQVVELDTWYTTTLSASWTDAIRERHSGGQKTRLTLVLMIHRRMQKPVWIFDEPEQGIDPNPTAYNIISRILSTWPEKTILVVTHLETAATRFNWTAHWQVTSGGQVTLK